MVSSILPPNGTGRPSADERLGAGFGIELPAPRKFSGAGHGGDNDIPLGILTTQVGGNQNFEGYQPFHSRKELEAGLVAAGVTVVPRGADSMEDTSTLGTSALGTSTLGALTTPPRRGA